MNIVNNFANAMKSYRKSSLLVNSFAKFLYSKLEDILEMLLLSLYCSNACNLSKSRNVKIKPLIQ